MDENNINNIINEVLSQGDKIWEVASKIWNFGELALEENNSSAISAKYLEDNGFIISDRGVGALKTSWVATWGGNTKPIIGFTVEFDALPGLGNESTIQKTPRKDGNINGHGCGHNLVGTGAICAAVALKNHLVKNKIEATIKVFGCPAEEIITGKNFMAQAGVFDSLDACLHWHPHNKNTVLNEKVTAIAIFRVEFFGKSSHAALTPWEGRSAAHATEIFLHGINVMREQMLPESRIHYLVEKSGDAVNVIPEYAKIKLIYRGHDAENVEQYLKWIEDIATGAALVTQTTAKFTRLAACYDLLLNQTMADRVMHYLYRVGAPKWSEEEQKFAKGLQKTNGYEELGLDPDITPDPKGYSVGGSTDVGDVSYITPTMGVVVAAWPQHISAHTWEVAACVGTSIGQKAMMVAAQVLALTGFDLIADKEFLMNAKKEFAEKMKGKKYKSLCPADGPVIASDGTHATKADLQHEAIHNKF